MEVLHGVITKIYSSDCAYNKVIIEDRIIQIGPSAAAKLEFKEIIFPECLITIGSYAFLDCINLEEVHLPSSLKEIGERAFSGCRALKKINLPEGLNEITAGLFNGCENLKEINIPQSVKKISARAFANCKRLKKIIIPESVEIIDWAAFAGCENLEEIEIPDTVRVFNYQIFLNCKGLKKVKLPKSLINLPYETFKGCKSLTNVENIHLLKEIGAEAFAGCTKLKAFPESAIIFAKGCFQNCKNIDNIVLNKDTQSLAEAMFEGCIRLKTISCEKKLIADVRSFKNCVSLSTVPDFIKDYGDYSFEGCNGLTLVDCLKETIPNGCFRNCKNLLKVNNSDKVKNIGAFAFYGCESLLEFDCSNSLDNIPDSAFEKCKYLRMMVLPCHHTKIGNRAFYGCELLSEFYLPEMLEEIGSEALKGCHSISSLTFPANLKIIGNEAFGYMNSLINIAVDNNNPYYMTPDNIIVLHKIHQKLVLYASGNPDEEYALSNYCCQTSVLGRDIINPITYIYQGAFAGAKNLKSLILSACTSDVECNAFAGCDNLKTLYIKYAPLFSMHGFRIRENGDYLKDKTKAFLPFENLYLDGELIGLHSGAYAEFNKLKNVYIENGRMNKIETRSFIDSKLIEEINIPECVSKMSDQVFAPNTILCFSNGLRIKSKDLKAVGSTGGLRHYSTKDGKHYIERADHFVLITNAEIKALFTNSEDLLTKPWLAVRQLELMKFYGENDEILRNGKLITIFSKNPMTLNSLEALDNDENRKKPNINCLKKLAEHLEDIKPISHYQYSNGQIALATDDIEKLKDIINLQELSQIINIKLTDKNNGMFIPELIMGYDEILIHQFDDFTLALFSSIKKIIDPTKMLNYLQVLRKYKATDSFLMNHIFIEVLNQVDYETLISSFDDYLKQVIEKGNLLANEGSTIKSVKAPDSIFDYINILRKYEIKNSYLMNRFFIEAMKLNEYELFIRLFDKNMKRMIDYSKALGEGNSAQNITNLMSLARILGGLDEDPIKRQRAQNFIIENIFMGKEYTNDKGETKTIQPITGNDIYRKFNTLILREELDDEFIDFFMKNYKEIYEKEIFKAGFMCRVYNAFPDISRTSTSNKGYQRHLVVTFDKAWNYLLTNKFTGITEETEELAKLLGQWFDNDETFHSAVKVWTEAKKSPRNIFTTYTMNEEKELVFDNDPAKDLREEPNGEFTYEWLPKQDIDNLVLGKYCDCCAHIARAKDLATDGMISINHQNLVIRNQFGNIIGKAILYVNRREGYAVFNNVESSFNYRSPEELSQIHLTFLRGARAFMDTFNTNNHFAPIRKVTVGEKSNTIITQLQEAHKTHPILSAPKFGEYNGDSSNGQRLILSFDGDPNEN